MFRAVRFASLLLCLSLLPGIELRAQDSITDTQTELPNPASLFEPREYASQDGQVLRYRLLKPLDYDPNQTYPLLIFLHGAGERGKDNIAQLKHCMAELCQPARRQRHPCFVLAPQCPEDQLWTDLDWRRPPVAQPVDVSPAMRLLFEVTDLMVAEAGIDKNRITIAGLSMGGYGTWDALYRRPDFFAAGLPMCGGAAPSIAETIKHVPIWCFHGDQDSAVNVQYSRDLISSLKKCGAQPKYTEYPGVGHNCWTQTFAKDEVLDWLFTQRRDRTRHIGTAQEESQN